MEGTEEYHRAEGWGNTASLLGRRVEGMADQVVARVDGWIMEEVRKSGRDERI